MRTTEPRWMLQPQTTFLERLHYAFIVKCAQIANGFEYRCDRLMKWMDGPIMNSLVWSFLLAVCIFLWSELIIHRHTIARIVGL